MLTQPKFTLIVFAIMVIASSVFSQNDTIIKRGSIFHIRKDSVHLVYKTIVIENDVKIKFSKGVTCFSLTSERLQMGKNISIDGRGRDGKMGGFVIAPHKTANCTVGKAGAQGKAGTDGTDGVNILIATSYFSYLSFTANTSGGNGGKGGRGGAGGRGADGFCGPNGCAGQEGGTGGQGGNGGNGGDAGIFIIKFKFLSEAKSDGAEVKKPIVLRQGGEAGKAGAGGNGGAQGKDSKDCFTKIPGPKRYGESGEAGQAGRSGKSKEGDWAINF